MNQKKAKSLRRIARESVPAGAPYAKWEIANASRFRGHPGTVELAKNCVRAIYRKLKKAGA